VTIFDLAPWAMGFAAKGVIGALRYRARHLAWSRIAHRTFTLTETVRQDVIKRFRVSSDAVVVTPLGCDEAAPQTEVSTAAEERILKKYRLDGRTYVISISGLDRSRRNPLFLLEAFAECHRYLPDDLYFVFTGNSFQNPGEYERALHRMEMLGIKDRVVMTGFVSDQVFQVLVANAAVSVVTPFYSGTPMAVLDAFAYGVPLVASDRGAIPEIAGEAAVFVDPYDSKAIANAVRGLIERPIEHETYAEKGLNRAKEFSWERMAEKTLASYQEVSSVV